MSKKQGVVSVVLAIMMLVAVLVGCNKPTEPQKPTEKASYTVEFDVGNEAEADGVSNPAKQTVKTGTTAVEPTIDYREGYELSGWYNGSAKWNFTTDKVTQDIKLTADWKQDSSADVAEEYEKNLTWGEKDHLYVHYLRGADDPNEHGTTNSAQKPNYSEQIESEVYGDWGLWVWEYLPTNSEGRAFYPMKLDESGAVYDIDLTATYNDAGWDADVKDDKNLTIDYKESNWLGLQLFSQDSRINGQGFWVNDGGDVYIDLTQAKRDKGDYHWFVRQGEAQNGTPKYESFVVFDPYEGLEPGSAVTDYDVVSHKGNNNVYVQQKVAEGWDEDSVGYQIFMASFADSDGDGMGDIQGIIDKLDYLKDLGVDVLWLTPFQQSNSYHGYDIKDYFSVDPRFGTLADYRELLYKAHEKGMKVLLDFVLNHTSTSNPWFEKSVKLVKETIKLPDGTMKVIDYRNFYTWTNEDNVPKTGNAAKQWFKDSNGYYYYSSFNSSMPELNFDYQATRDAILQVALYWMSFGLDGFRLDAVKHIYMENENSEHSTYIVKDISESGDYSFDMLKNEHFFLEFNAKLKATYPGAILVGENFNGDPIKIAGLYAGMDSQFNFNWYYDTTGCLGTVSQSSSSSVQYEYAKRAMNQYNAAQFDFRLYREDYIDGVFTSNHDVQRARDRLLVQRSDAANDWVGNGVRVGTEFEAADVQLSGELAKIWAGMCMTVPGITWIYNGDELGMFGTKKDNAPGEGAGHEDRWYRQPMKWSKDFEGDSANCKYDIGFNNYIMTWDSLNMNLDGVAEQSKDANSIYSAYKALIALRKSDSVFRNGVVTNLTRQQDSIIAYSISNDKSEYRILVNATQNERKPLQGITGELVYSSSNKTAAEGMIPGLTLVIYKVK